MDDGKLENLDANWLEQVAAWVHENLETNGYQATGPFEVQHIRLWSTVLRIPTEHGLVYFKYTSSTFGSETAITHALARWQPDCTPHLLASDTKRRWLLMADGGIRLRTVLQEEGGLEHWHSLLPIYAGMQRNLAGHVPEMLRFGLPDRRLGNLPALYEELLMDKTVLLSPGAASLTEEEYDFLSHYAPEFSRQCEKLADYGIPETLQHDDLHGGNILVQNGRYYFFDWGDSCISHPFFSMVISLRSAAHPLGAEPDDPALYGLTESYLTPWRGFLSDEDLQAAFELAQRIGMVCRALTWYRLVDDLDGTLKEEYSAAVCSWLRMFFNSVTRGSPGEGYEFRRRPQA